MVGEKWSKRNKQNAIKVSVWKADTPVQTVVFFLKRRTMYSFVVKKYDCLYDIMIEIKL